MLSITVGKGGEFYWATGVVIWQCVLAWFAALIVRAALILLGVV